MQALSPEQYARLRALAEAWTYHHLKAAKALPQFNPRLVADALCFQPLRDAEHGELLLGALVTPLSLSLALAGLPASAGLPAPAAGSRLRIALPSGHYDLEAFHVDADHWCWRCVLLDDLSDLPGREAASRLAQQLMERVMAPDEAR
ncbi:hypothetical protein BDK63_001391 [Halomonas campaniensis]|uniref:[NiFe]-hydrogenase assembly, chaperone, HybE n=1 Tax=Halomonas campaniensis TaxID=213554 RepID=A0A7W5K228_9GAMM|nr:[NiFe]-hydrogenase assembly chaperone HybE [Halomonas campaniensis]MBB3330525.1 hypothetical protein [Halomonas campaniensis]